MAARTGKDRSMFRAEADFTEDAREEMRI